MKEKVIIGITGTIGAGKGTIVDILKEKGFRHYSVRNYLTKILLEGNQELSRDNMVDLANNLRADNSPSFIVEELYKEAQQHEQNAIIESIRNPGEIKALEKLGDFYLLAIDASPEIRYERTEKRKSSTDNISYEKFVGNELREITSSDPNKQNISACIWQSDYLIQNDTDMKKLKETILSEKYGFLNTINTKRRPAFDEMFMRQAYEWGQRSTCMRREVGALLVKDNRILAQGYNGSPRGAPHCSDIGTCLRQEENIPSGQRDEKCEALHAEPNAILNCETREARIGATMYLTTQPCSSCARLIANSGIEKVIYLVSYPSEMTKRILEASDVKLEKYTGVTPKGYPKFWN